MARFSFALNDQTAGTLLAGMAINIKNAAGTLLASTSPPGAEKQVVDNADGTYYVDDMAANLITVYVGASQTAQPELTSIPWDNGAGATHSALTTAHGSTGAVIGQGNVDDSSIEYSGGLRVKALGIASTMLAALAVTTAKIALLNVTTGVIANLAVTLGKMAADSVDENKIVSTTLGDGLTGGSGTTLSVDVASTPADAIDFAFNAGGELVLLKALSSTTYLSADKTLGQLLSIIDNRMRQLSEQTGANDGRFFQILYTPIVEGTPPSGGLSPKVFEVADAAYGTMFTFYIVKIPEMRQVVLYYNADQANGADAYVKIHVGSLSKESDVITTAVPLQLAIYLDISSLANWAIHTVYVEAKIAGGAETLDIQGIAVIARDEITAVSGETTYAITDPVE